MKIRTVVKGSFEKTEKFLKRISSKTIYGRIESYAKEGVDALRSATPVDSGITSESWGYKINYTKGGVTITWTNEHKVKGVPIAIILQYGHGTRNGGYVKGEDYINPAIKATFDKIQDSVWREVKNS